MKYAIIIPDGAADQPHAVYGGKTALEVAEIPYMHQLVSEGISGLACNVPQGMPPGSDVANLSIMGFDPKSYYTGRAPLEAANRGITLTEGQAVFRANLVTIIDGKMIDFAGGHPTNEEANSLIDYLSSKLNIEGVRLHHGVSYRHLCVVDGLAENIPQTTPPHDITGQGIVNNLPREEILCKIMNRSVELLPEWEGNKLRADNGKAPITQLWLWGGGVMPEIPSYQEKYNLTGAMISAVDLLFGIARLAGLDIIEVEGATGFYDTNYRGKAEAAIKALENHDLVVVHVEAPDEASHNGEPEEKLKALKKIDSDIVKPLMQSAEEKGDMRILCLPDHPTPIALKTHTSDPVPFSLWGAGVSKDQSECFTESGVTQQEIAGYKLIDLLISENPQL